MIGASTKTGFSFIDVNMCGGYISQPRGWVVATALLSPFPVRTVTHIVYPSPVKLLQFRLIWDVWQLCFRHDRHSDSVSPRCGMLDFVFMLIQQDLQSFSSLSDYSFCLIRLVRKFRCFTRSGSCISLCNVRQYCLFRQDVAYLTLFCTYLVDSCIILSWFGKFVSRQDWPTPQKNFGSNGAECSVVNTIL